MTIEHVNLRLFGWRTASFTDVFVILSLVFAAVVVTDMNIKLNM